MQSLSIKDGIIAVLLGLAIADYVNSIWVVLVIVVLSYGLLCLVDYYEIRGNKNPTPDD